MKTVVSSNVYMWVFCVQLLTTNPKNYVVRPRIGILLPGSVLHVTGSFCSTNMEIEYSSFSDYSFCLLRGIKDAYLFVITNSVYFTVTMRAVREPPLNMRCKDKFMIRSAVASPGATTEDVRTMVVITGLVTK